MSKSVLWSQATLEGAKLSKEEMDAVLAASNRGFSVLKSILESKLAQCHKARSDVGGYDSPSWAYKQADLNGEERSLRMILDLLGPVCYNKPT